jgi:sulfite reductase beta subunit-like hemoprotein
MTTPNIPAAKRAGLPVDLARLTAEGDRWLSPEERYALKTHGVCAQAQPGVFMIRCRTGGSVPTASARGIADLSDVYASGWIHLTTRQQMELHHVDARDVTTVLDGVRRAGLTTRSACGHTMRGVMSCPDAGVGLEEPFDCHPDATAAAQSILARTPELDTKLPSRVNVHFGGCTECRNIAKVNDAGFVSIIGNDGDLGYELWIGGSLGKSVPTLAIKALDFVSRRDVLPALNALFDVYIEHGDFEQPTKARMKFLVRRLGAAAFIELFSHAFERARERAWPEPAKLSTPLSASIAEILSVAPEGGWSSGVRPQRVPGWAMVTVNVPLGDLRGDELRIMCDIADDIADGHLYLTRNQNAMFRWVPLAAVPAVRAALSTVGLGLDGADQARDVAVCTGGPVCSLALTPAQSLAARLLDHPALERNSDLQVKISGCPNACAQHQIADLGFSGGKVTIAGTSMLGYQVWLGGDLATDSIGRVVGRVADPDVPAITEAIVGAWEALRDRGETLSATVARLGIEGFKAQIAAVFKGRWEPGPEPEDVARVAPVLEVDRRLPLLTGGA